mmetsp:Transcript_9560/g.31221  ORF Transcript_9560/g.31221 Transcript_9560/m.31221 type:complete len:273 (+) Transcript_9560:79-897(+)
MNKPRHSLRIMTNYFEGRRHGMIDRCSAFTSLSSRGVFVVVVSVYVVPVFLLEFLLLDVEFVADVVCEAVPFCEVDGALELELDAPYDAPGDGEEADVVRDGSEALGEFVVVEDGVAVEVPGFEEGPREEAPRLQGLRDLGLVVLRQEPPGAGGASFLGGELRRRGAARGDVEVVDDGHGIRHVETRDFLVVDVVEVRLESPDRVRVGHEENEGTRLHEFGLDHGFEAVEDAHAAVREALGGGPEFRRRREGRRPGVEGPPPFDDLGLAVLG